MSSKNECTLVTPLNRSKAFKMLLWSLAILIRGHGRMKHHVPVRDVINVLDEWLAENKPKDREVVFYPSLRLH